MSYKELYKKNNETLKERYELVSERIRTISNMKEAEVSIEEKYASFFVKISQFLVKLQDVLEKEKSGELLAMSAEEGKALNDSLFDEIKKENYDLSFANPAFAVKTLGKDFGQLFSAIFASVINIIPTVFQGDYTFICIYEELILEIYTIMQDREGFTYKAVQDSYYWFKHDYIEVVMEDKVNKLINPEYDYYQKLIDMSKDGIDYLYKYGFYISNDEIESARYLATFSDEEIVRLFEAADNFKTIKREGWPSNMVFPMILRILYCCGLRVGEALNLTWEDVDLKTGVIRIKQAKNDRQRNVPMDPSLTEILKQYKRQRYGVENSTSYIFESPKNPGHPYLVWTVRSWFIHALDAAGIDVSRSKKFEHTISPHTLRHFFAYKSFLQAERSGLSLEQFAPYLSSYLGHASLLETEKYISTDYTLYKDSHDRVNVAISHVFPEVDFDE